MSVVSWTKLTLSELKDLCVACNLSDKGSKEELSERLHAYFEKRKGKQPSTPSGKTVGETDGGNEKPKVDIGVDNGDDFDVEWFVDLEGDDIDAESQEADGKVRDEFASRFPGKGKVESVPVDIFLSALGNLEKKLDRSFSALHNEIEEGEVLDAAWPKVRLSKPRDQHEYDFLTKIGRRLDRAIRMLSSSLRKDFVDIRDEVEARVVTLRLADNKGWSAALQIVGSNDKMMEKYKDRIPLAGQAETMFRTSNWGYRSRSKYSQQKRKRYSSPSSDSERGEFYKKGKKRDKRSYSFRGKESFNFAERRGAITCFNCGGVGHIASGCPSSGSKAVSKSRNED
ncbi:hypothetical protein C2G38_1195966 [Gigaspora rosea]|uniref:CCHC-type domain-containing protein n=1 Tax=Gigaspora rosea TaxID=44941 RepID=A0A397VDA0_9GLOM|nr:hypothetical protein C2G38_1195966 [Gigaspora rosea]